MSSVLACSIAPTVSVFPSTKCVMVSRTVQVDKTNFTVKHILVQVCKPQHGYWVAEGDTHTQEYYNINYLSQVCCVAISLSLGWQRIAKPTGRRWSAPTTKTEMIYLYSIADERSFIFIFYCLMVYVISS